MSALRADMRKIRADQAAASILHFILDKYIAEVCRDDCARELYGLFREHGVEIITDLHRQEAGLPARGPDGWTLEELVILEKHRLEMLSKPLTMKIDP